MTDVIKALCDYLSKSPSVVYSQDVLEYLPAIEAENAKLKADAERMFQANVEKNNEVLGLLAENAKLLELLLDYDKMLAIAADELGYQSRGLRMDSVLNALRIRMYELGIETDE